ncbi:MAG: flavin reductase family protein [Lachnospiraceae bacterium]|nr:flavin reductase family protein [Lachnospiraceae bacterium]
MGFTEINVKELDKNPFVMIGDEWMLITAKKDGKVNTMTASWGGVGIMWGKTVATAYIRPQRYTKCFVDSSEYFTLTFFGGEHKKAMGYLGRVSGKDEPDKIDKTDIHVTEIDGQPTFEEANLVLVCRKLYVQEMQKDCFTGTEEIEQWYPAEDYHTMYMAEIVKAYRK